MPTTTDKPKRQVEKKGAVARIGNLTRDPELRFGASGTAYANAGLAVETPKEPGNWSGERETVFYELTFFGSLAENAVASLRKGERVVVIGKAEVETWQGDDGKPRTTKRILVDGCGPDLRWATATPARTGRTAPAEPSTIEAATEEEEPF